MDKQCEDCPSLQKVELIVLQIVGLGLCGVFELVRETREHYPELCIKAMKALLDMLQGQLPESMKHEPADIVGEYSISTGLFSRGKTDLTSPGIRVMEATNK